MSDRATQRLLAQVANLERKLANMVMIGPITDVKGDKVRMQLGKGKDGKEVKSPWIHTANHRGGARERRFFKGPQQQDGQGGQGGQGGAGGGAGGAGGGQGGEQQDGGGQNVIAICMSGDPRQAFVIAQAPNENHPAPDHANKSGQDEETYQLEDLRVSKAKDGYDIWLEEPEKKKQGGSGGDSGGEGGESGQSGQKEERKTGGEKARVKFRLHNDGGITGRIGTGKDAVRYHIHKDGAKLKAGDDNIVLVDKKEGQVKVKSKQPPITNQAWVVKDWKDPIEDDNK
jgi:hypothetical protein